MARWIEGNLFANGTRLHYYRTGGQKPPVVLVHGITDDGLCWTPVAERLAARYDIIMVDMRAHGKSEAPDSGYTYETMATELAGLITGLDLENPALLGHSMGGVTVLALASLFPRMPSAIIVEDPPNWWDAIEETPEMLERRAGMIAWMRAIKQMGRAELLQEVRQLNPNWQQAELGPWVDSKLRFNLNIIDLVKQYEDMTAGKPAILRRIACPALLMTADPAQGAALNEKDAKSLNALIPHLVHTHIPGAGHNIRRDQYAKYMDIVENFLEKTVGTV